MPSVPPRGLKASQGDARDRRWRKGPCPFDPAKRAMEKRTNIIKVRFNDTELAVAQAKAQETGHTLASYARHAALGTNLVRAADRSALREAVAGLGRAGNLLNQVARKLNEGQVLDAEHVRPILELTQKKLDKIGVTIASNK